MRYRTRINIIMVCVALLVGWLWSVRWVDHAYVRSHVFGYPRHRIALLNLWPDISRDYITLNNSPKLLDKTLTISELAQRQSLTDNEKAHLAYQLNMSKSDFLGRILVTPYNIDSPADKLALCIAGERLDPDNGLYPLYEAIVRLDSALGDVSTYRSPSELLAKAPKTDTNRYTPMQVSSTGRSPAWYIVDRKELTLALAAFERASQKSVNLHTEVADKRLSPKPVLYEQYLANSAPDTITADTTFSAVQNKFANKLSFIGPQLVKMGNKAEAEQLMNSLVKYTHRNLIQNANTLLGSFINESANQQNINTASELAGLLGLGGQKAVYDKVSQNITQVKQQQRSIFANRVVDGGLSTKYVYPIKEAPANSVAASRMLDYVLADECMFSAMLAAWVLLLAAGVIRVTVWNRANKKRGITVPELKMGNDYRRLLVAWLIVPLVAYMLLTASASLPWRSQTISTANTIEKGIVLLLALVVPWVYFRGQFKRKCQQSGIAVPSSGFELMMNLMPLIGFIPMMLLIYTAISDSGHYIVHNPYEFLIFVCMVLIAAGAVWAFKHKTQFGSYYAAAARYIVPMYVWSIIAVSVVFMPALLGREISLLKQDEVGLGAYKYGRYTTQIDQDHIVAVKAKLTQAVKPLE